MQEEKNSKYSAEYIRKYFDGELSDQAMQALEKAALEDPFLADAMEGFEESRKHSISFESGITDLKTKLSERISQRKRKTGMLFHLSKWQMAASFIVVIGLAVLTVTLVNKKPGISQTIAKPDTTNTVFNQPPQENINRNDSVKPDEHIAASDGQAVSSDEHVIASAKPLKTAKISERKKEKTSIQKADESPLDQNTGKSSASTPSGVLSDTTQETEKSEVLAKKDIVMPNAAAAKSEDRVEGYSGIDMKRVASPTENYLRGVIIGWDAFVHYIDSNKKINSADSLLKGEEVISFLLHPDGKLSSFKVEKSVSKTHDAEILRLIQTAPALKLEEKKKQRCRLLIRFK